MRGTDLPLKAIRELIFSAVHHHRPDIAVFRRHAQADFHSGTRLHARRRNQAPGNLSRSAARASARTDASRGSITATGVIPTFVEELRQAGIEVDMSMFVPTSDQ
jgi:hypothetical protein